MVVDQRSVRHGGTSVDVFTGCPRSVEVMDSHGIVLGTATLPAAGSFPVTLSTPLLVGETYVARVPGTAIAESFRCLRRHGFPETFANGTRMETILLHPAAYTVGNARFSIRARLVRSGNMGPELAFSGLMIVGFDGTPILPVENGQGTNQLLLSEFWFGATGMVAENARDGFLTMSLPIPNDPTLEGTILLAQFVVSDTASLRLGEIVGFKIGAAN